MNPGAILILEDERPAATRLLAMVRKRYPEASLTWYRSAAEARPDLSEHRRFDLILSDIELLDGPVFPLFREFEPACPIIFCTAYDHYYVEAFLTTGIAYLLKPYSKEAVEAAFAKFERLFGADPSNEALHTFLRKQYKNSYAVKHHAGTYLLPVETITCFRAQGDFVEAYDQAGKRHFLNTTLRQIGQEVDPRQFYRINRSEILAFSAIDHVTPHTKNRLAILLTDGQTVLYTSNARSPGFRAWLEGR